MKQESFDQMCAEYIDLLDESSCLKEKVDQAKAAIMRAVEAEGVVPTNAQASRRIEGARYMATLTAGTSVDVLDANVTELELVMSAAKLSDIFRQLFTRRVEYTLVKDADKVMKQTSFPKTLSTRIQKLWSQSFVVKGKTPSLKVEAIKPAEDLMRRIKKGARQ